MQNKNETMNEQELEAIAGIVPTKSFVLAEKKIMATVKENRMLAVIGSIGLGKTKIKNITMGRLREKRYIVVDILPVFLRGKNFTGSIASTMIRELSGEVPAQDVIARATQLHRVLISAAKKQNIVLVIDEAQDLQRDTMYGLKKMHELGGSTTKQFLFSIILFGKDELSAMIRPNELGLRFDTHQMVSLTMDEMRSFVTERGIKIDKKGMNRLLLQTFPTPAAIERRLHDLMYYLPNQKSFSEKDILDYFLRDLPSRIKASGKSYSELIDELKKRTGTLFNKSDISRAINGKLENVQKQDTILESLQDILSESIQRSTAAAGLNDQNIKKTV